jgi:anti-sigma factor RsiW
MKYGEGSEGHMFSKDSSEKQCAALEGKLVEYLDGRAKPAERHAVEEHLSGCASCRLRAEEFRMVWTALDDLPAISPSPAFDASLRARIAAEPAPRSFWDWLPSPRLAFAVTALLVMSVWLSSVPRVTTHPSMVSHAIESIQASKVTAESDFGMIRDLPVLENYDVVSKFDALSELPGPPTASPEEVIRETR